jgi:hypothetical protein
MEDSEEDHEMLRFGCHEVPDSVSNQIATDQLGLVEIRQVTSGGVEKSGLEVDAGVAQRLGAAVQEESEAAVAAAGVETMKASRPVRADPVPEPLPSRPRMTSSAVE